MKLAGVGQSRSGWASCDCWYPIKEDKTLSPTDTGKQIPGLLLTAFQRNAFQVLEKDARVEKEAYTSKGTEGRFCFKFPKEGWKAILWYPVQ